VRQPKADARSCRGRRSGALTGQAAAANCAEMLVKTAALRRRADCRKVSANAIPHSGLLLPDHRVCKRKAPAAADAFPGSVAAIYDPRVVIQHYFREEAAIAGDLAAAARAAATGAKALKTAATLPSMRAWKRSENRRVEFNDRAVHERERSNKPDRQ
jgi:hypothetical protein